MSKDEENLWQGIEASARDALVVRDYETGSFAQRLRSPGVEAGELMAVNRRQPEVKRTWIAGDDIFARKIFAQLHRGSFGEFVCRNTGALAKIGLWSTQGSAARTLARTAKGFHVHPPSLPADTTSETWHGRSYIRQPQN